MSGGFDAHTALFSESTGKARLFEFQVFAIKGRRFGFYIKR